jgi:hypothetical protein
VLFRGLLHRRQHHTAPRFMTKSRIGRAGVSGPKDRKAKALAGLHRLHKLPEVVRSFFGDPNLRYITA